MIIIVIIIIIIIIIISEAKSRSKTMIFKVTFSSYVQLGRVIKIEKKLITKK